MNALLGDDIPTAESALPCLTILFHPDVRRIGEIAVLSEVAEEAESVLARRELGFSPPHGGESTPLHDPYLSRRPVRFSAARFGGIRLDCRDSGTRVVANGDWIPADRVFLGVEVKRGVVLVLSERVVLLLHNRQEFPVLEAPSYGMIGFNSEIVHLRRRIQAAAEGDETLLLRGEAGSGKTTAATAIHRHSPRGEGPFVQVDLQDKALQLESALAEASGGTLLIKGIEKLAGPGQEELLRTLEANDAATRVDTRILTATSAKAARRWHKAPEPLLKRLSQNSVTVPPLPDRRDDIGRLLIYFLQREVEKADCAQCLEDPGPYHRPWLSVRVTAHLAGYEWPRNVMQLKNVIRRLVAEHGEREELTHGPALEQLLEKTAESRDYVPEEEPQTTTLRSASEISEGELLTALRAHRWQARPTAAQLQISEEDLFAMIEKLSESTRRRRRRRRPPPPS